MSVLNTPEPQKIPVNQTARGLNALWFPCSCKALHFRKERRSDTQAFSDRRNTDERMADLEDSGKVSSFALLRLSDLLQRGATMNPAFDILKKTDLANFEWVEVVRDLQTAEARIQELQARSPGEYVVFSQQTQEIVGRFNSLMAGAGET